MRGRVEWQGDQGGFGSFFNSCALGWRHHWVDTNSGFPPSKEISLATQHTSQPWTTAILAQQTSPCPQPAPSTGPELRTPSHTCEGQNMPKPDVVPDNASLHPLGHLEKVWTQCCLISSFWCLTLDPLPPYPEIWDRVTVSPGRQSSSPLVANVMPL